MTRSKQQVSSELCSHRILSFPDIKAVDAKSTTYGSAISAWDAYYECNRYPRRWRV